MRPAIINASVEELQIFLLVVDKSNYSPRQTELARKSNLYCFPHAGVGASAYVAYAVYAGWPEIARE
jgi:hypothetical protein